MVEFLSSSGLKLSLLRILYSLEILHLFVAVHYCGAEKLDEYILDYQRLSLDNLHRNHERVRRSLDKTLRINFRAYNRHFPLLLKPDRDIFSPDHFLEDGPDFAAPVDTSFIYSGHVQGVPKSYAHVAIINGSMRGHVHIPGDTIYHIDAAEQYFDRPSFHSVIYPESRMDKDPFRHKRSSESLGSCGVDHVKDWMDRVARSAVPDADTSHARRKRWTEEVYHTESESPQSKYFPGSRRPPHNTEQEPKGQSKRKKRALLGLNNTCFLYLRSDPMMWNFVQNEKFKRKLTDERVKEEILAFFASHVSALKNIFHRTVFTTYNDDLHYSGVNFVVQRTSIMTPENQRCGSPAASSYCNPNIDVSNFLNLNSMDKHDEFCLAYIFTHRDFTRGTLGLAWVGAREVASGGICERHRSYLERDETVPKSLNTGIVTTVNYRKAVPARVSQLTFTHEVGHNFGSPHDQGVDCAPFGSEQPNAHQGNYIMFASATMGDRPNNDDFSTCSKDNITRMLHVVINELNGKRNCFKPSKTAFCGNGIKEAGEECDCGYQLDCEDRCCYGRGSEEGEQCTLKPNVKCSPTAGPCCTSECEFVSASDNMECLPSDDCKSSAYCNGSMAACPEPKLEPNGTTCNEYAQMCHKGECVSSICERIKWKECFLTASPGDEGPSREALCYVSCEHPRTGQCVSSHDLGAVNKPENIIFKILLVNVTRVRSGKLSATEPEGIQLPAGSPCDNFRGYCDVFHKCRGVDADGPLARLKNLIFDPETLENIQQWIVHHWWAVLLMAVALIVVMGAFIKVCAVHTPSSNPRKPKHRQLTLPRTLQRRNRQRRQQQQQQQQPSSSGGGGGRSVPAGGGGGGRSVGAGRSVGGGSNKPTTSEVPHSSQIPEVLRK
ncbi:disintegrin and metalloproteinase domain-containing protein 10 [Aplysia californica]|uniref:ADAM10 endopeptidase n=1 Tax=Aplysia californica TaxID=6500 RepID=A0ABM0K9A9_APLCA|nr:disintegrin and metalloproteinase domain-containing protein 10 [Aplysia californica]